VFIAAVVILIEDWLWDDLARIAAAIGRLPLLRQTESLIVSLPPYPSLALFATPSLLLVPVKLAALYFIAHGQPTLGLVTVVVAKIAGTALVARIFILTRPKLMLIGWFSRLYERFIAFKTRVFQAIKATAVYKAAHLQYLRLKATVKQMLQRRRGFWKRRWEAALRLSRKWKHSEE